ncbi:sugar 3,4-ketoisomerase [Pontibacter virosus]|uniref:WxcM-like protein n=1 Tax=Pontibacter virosus TaxID=1765052 RepID=A0A2U1AZI7_9BACT|nr:FdtA/QdtA family cupin domain-containing protein [Pontibacter virosus]PVY41846.1 WxcM-like protein [Pontibacter virosus]
MSATPYLIHFTETGSPEIGFIASTQLAQNIPFVIKRVFWTYGTPTGVLRGQHANRATEEVLIAATGSIRVETDNGKDKQTFVLDDPATGLYLPAMCWTDLHFAPGTVAVCLTSTDFEESDYIRDYPTFQRLAAHPAL